MIRETFRINRCGGNDDFQILALVQQALQVTQQEVDVEAALMRLIDDDRVVSLEQRIMLRLGEQNAVRHQLDQRIGRGAILKTHLDADPFADTCVELFGHTPRD